MDLKKSIRSQYHASLLMLQQAIDKCPAPLWVNVEYKNPFWHLVFHTLYYTHLYLHPRKEDYVPWEKHRDGYISLSNEETRNLTPYTRGEMLEFLAFCLAQMEEKVSRLDLEAESGFHWLPFDKLELQFYNIRHIMQHTGELSERLGARGDVEINWDGGNSCPTAQSA